MCYESLLTLSVTQVSCERSFSKLKCVKTYLRNTLSQGLLDSFLIMSVEKDLLSKINPKDIIDMVATKSEKNEKFINVNNYIILFYFILFVMSSSV